MLKNISPMHPRPAGSGFHLPSIPHTALILPTGTNPGLHLKNISAPSSVLWYASMEPLSGVLGLPQLTGIMIIKFGRKGRQNYTYITILLMTFLTQLTLDYTPRCNLKNPQK